MHLLMYFDGVEHQNLHKKNNIWASISVKNGCINNKNVNIGGNIVHM